jgi:hypothetical protein
MNKRIGMGWALISASVALAAGAAQGACTGDRIESCPEIEPGGCPTDHGGTCDDPYCTALYRCDGGVWKLVEHCPVGGGGNGGVGPGGSGGAGQGGCEALSIDDSEAQTGCWPDLQVPDCPAEAAETCHPCLTGCSDFYLCLADGPSDVAWSAVAFCNEDDEVELYP